MEQLKLHAGLTGKTKKHLHKILLMILNCSYHFHSRSFTLITIIHFVGGDFGSLFKVHINKIPNFWNRWLSPSTCTWFCCHINSRQLNTAHCKKSRPPTFLSYLAFQSTTNRKTAVNETRVPVLDCEKTLCHSPYFTLPVINWLPTNANLLFYSTVTCRH